MKKLFSLCLAICAIAVIPVQAMTSEEKILTCRDSVTVTMSLRAYGNAYLADYYEIRPVCSNEGTLTFVPSLSGSLYPVQGPDYWCREEINSSITDMEGYVSYPSFFFFMVSKGGDLILEISQVDSDVDYIIWGPFDTPNVRLQDLSYDKIDARPITVGGWTETSGTLPNCNMCSISIRETEYARIDDVEEGEFYILMISNYGQTTNPISIMPGPGNTAETDCEIVLQCGFTDAEVNSSAVYAENGSQFFDIDGRVWFYNQPGSGTLTITDKASGLSTALEAPFVSPASFSIRGIPANGGSDRVLEVSFSDGDCDNEINYVASEIPQVIEDTVRGEFCIGELVNYIMETDCEDCVWLWDSGETSDTVTYPVEEGEQRRECRQFDANGNLVGITTFVVNGIPCRIELETVVSDNTVCEPDEDNPCNGSIEVSASGGVLPYTYSWSNNPANAESSAHGLCTGTYTVVVTDAVGNTADATVEIITDGGNDEEMEILLCNGETYEFFDETISTTGTYTHKEISSMGCEYNTTLIVNAVDLSAATISGDGYVCAGTSVGVSVEGAPAGSSYLWSGPGADGMTGQNIVVSPTRSSGYSVKVSKDGCETILEKNIVIYPNPRIVTAGPHGENPLWLSATADGGTPPYMFQMDGTYTSADGIFDYVGKGYHVVAVEDNYGCEADTTVFFEIPVIPMKYFTPNGDGGNEQWTIENIGLVPAFVMIYDRYGRKLAEYGPGSFQGWDGTYNGHPMPSDDYWYLIRIASTGETMHGHFTLRR